MGSAMVRGADFDIQRGHVSASYSRRHHHHHLHHLHQSPHVPSPSLGALTQQHRNALHDFAAGRGGYSQDALVALPRAAANAAGAADANLIVPHACASASCDYREGEGEEPLINPPQDSSSPGKPKPQIWRPSRHRRLPVDSETFEPLDAVIEETQSAEASFEAHATLSSPSRFATPQVDRRDPEQHSLGYLAIKYDVQEQIEKHLAGHFEWLMTYPAKATLLNRHDSRSQDHRTSTSSESILYGCSMLRRGSSQGSPEHYGKRADGQPVTRAVLATPLTHTLIRGSESDESLSCGWPASVNPAWPLVDAIKAPEVKVAVHEMSSPSLSAVSEKSGSLLSTSADSRSYSPRIEDSLEELDKLEDALEAINDVALSPGLLKAERQKSSPAPTTLTEPMHSTRQRQSPVTGQWHTVRSKPSEKTKPTVRRASSLVLRDDKAEEGQGSKATPPDEDKRPGGGTQTAPQSAPKSQKRLTVPSFELPGEAIAKRLREQREARQARRAEAESLALQPRGPSASLPKSSSSPSLMTATRGRSARSMARPTFELPGEAISRRKREEHEAKLRAEAHDEQKKREFKARPVRFSTGTANLLPRDTVASRARQTHKKSPKDEAEVKRWSSSWASRRSPVVTPTPANRSRESHGRYREDKERDEKKKRRDDDKKTPVKDTESDTNNHDGKNMQAKRPSSSCSQESCHEMPERGPCVSTRGWLEKWIERQRYREPGRLPRFGPQPKPWASTEPREGELW